MPADLDALDAVMAEVTPGEWSVDHDGSCIAERIAWAIRTDYSPTRYADKTVCERLREPNARGIVALVNAWPELRAELAEWRRLAADEVRADMQADSDLASALAEARAELGRLRTGIAEVRHNWSGEVSYRLENDLAELLPESMRGET